MLTICKLLLLLVIIVVLLIPRLGRNARYVRLAHYQLFGAGRRYNTLHGLLNGCVGVKTVNPTRHISIVMTAVFRGHQY